VRGRVDRWPPARFFEGDDAGGESTSAKEKLSGRDQTVRDVKAPGCVVYPLHSQELAHIHDVEGYRTPSGVVF
jgi:hypothetical protein